MPDRKSPTWSLRHALACLLVAALAGCEAPPPAPPPPPPVVPVEAVGLDEAIAASVDSLAAQARPQKQEPPKPALSNLLGRTPEAKAPHPSAVLIDPSLDALTGQQTAFTRQIDQKVGQRLRERHTQFEVLAFQPSSLPRAELLLAATVVREQVGRGGWRLQMALADLKSGLVVAQTSALVRDDPFDTTPTPYYRDTPVVLIGDPVVDGYVRTSRTRPGSRADAVYLERVSAAAAIGEATTLYDAERYREALGLYRSALAAPTGEQMRAINGVYLSLWHLGNLAEAEQAFGQLVGMGLAARSLGVKFLFNPGSTEFWSDPKISGPYAIWLRQIARQAAASRVCLLIVGHTSHTGNEAFNDRLSTQRAAVVQRRLEAESPALAGRLKASGVGWRENLVGTGTDDASDSLDRRVEFKVNPC